MILDTVLHQLSVIFLHSLRVATPHEIYFKNPLLLELYKSVPALLTAIFKLQSI